MINPIYLDKFVYEYFPSVYNIYEKMFTLYIDMINS